MSVYYEIKEHLTAKINEENSNAGTIAENIIYMQRAQLALLYSRVLLDEAIKGDFKGLFDAMAKANKVDVVVDYSYRWNMNSNYLGIGPFKMMEVLDNLSEEEMDGIRYTVYNQVDGEGPGVICFYGVENGENKAGYSEADDRSVEGNWYTPIGFVLCDVDEIDPASMDRVKEICETFKLFGNPQQEQEEESCSTDSTHDMLKELGIKLPQSGCDEDMFLNEVNLHSNEDIQTFIDTVNKLNEVVGGIVETEYEFVDLSQKDPRMLKITILDDKTAKLELIQA